MSSSRRRGLARLAVLLSIVAAGLAAGAAAVLASNGNSGKPRVAAAARAPAPARTLSITCRSPSLGGSLPALVYLPAGYSARGTRYPVVYFLHGLPAGPGSYQQNGFVAAALAAAGRRAIVVTPQGARAANSDREYLDWGPTENWPQAIDHDLPACIDGRFHTIANRWGRALVGLSAGGYGAANVGLRALPVFSAVESWSGYFVATDPAGDHVLELGSSDADNAAAVPDDADLRTELRAWPALIGFYVGRQDNRFLAMNQQFDATLRQGGIAHMFAVYPGGHTYALWQAHAQQWLGAALDYMARGRAHR